MPLSETLTHTKPLRYLLLWLALVCASTQTLATPGDLDTSFGTAGSMITYAKPAEDTQNLQGTALAQDSDGNIYAGGNTHYILKYTSSGILDISFGDNGAAFVLAEVKAIKVLGSGKLLFTGDFGDGASGVGRLNADGSADTSFDADGYARLDTSFDFARTEDMAIQDDGGIVLVGNGFSDNVTYAMVARFNSDGSLDSSFGNDGLVSIHVEINDRLNSVALDANQKIVAAGSTQITGHGQDGLLVRLNTDGSLDTDFGSAGTGLVNLDLANGGPDTFYGLALQSDGSILATGLSGSTNIVLLARYTSSGQLDTDFGSSGTTLTSVQGGVDVATSVAVDSAEGIWVGGYTKVSGSGIGDPMILAYTSSGILDTTISDDGKAVFNWSDDPSYVSELLLQANGKLLLLGYADGDGPDALIVGRYTSTLAVDTSFGSSGLAQSSLAVAGEADLNALIVTDDAAILVGGRSSDPSYLMLKLDANGALDSTFGDQGRLVGEGVNLTAVAKQSDGHFIASGPGGSNREDLTLLRFDAAGNVDTNFGTDGLLTANIFDWYTHSPLLIQADDSIVVGGTQVDNDLGYEIMTLAHFDSAGNLVTTFGTAGYAAIDAGSGGYSAITSMVGDSQGRILITGDAYNSDGDGIMFASRFSATGQLDTSFGNNGRFELALEGYNLFSVAIGLQADGSIVLLAPTYGADNKHYLTVARLTPDGLLDNNFGSAGYTTVSFSAYANLELENLKILNDDSILAGGYGTLDTDQNLLVRFDANGNLDTSFGDAGIVAQITGISGGKGYGLALQPDGRILLAGYAHTGVGDMPAVTRYLNGPAQLELSPGSISFDDTENTQISAASELQLTNAGTAALTISSLSISDNFNLSGACSSINPGDSCTLSLTFGPTAEGAFTGNLTITSDLGETNVSLSGTGLPLDNNRDSDNDGLSDVLELSLDMNPNDASDFFLDSDGDHILDGDEALAGTDIHDAADFIGPLDTTVNGGGYFELSHHPSSDYQENYPSQLAMSPDGYLYFVGSMDGDESDFFLSRFDAHFNLDTGYGTEGFVYGTDLGLSTYYAHGYQIEANGDHLVLLPSCSFGIGCLMALNSDGSANTSRFSTQNIPGQILLNSSLDSSPIALKASQGGYIVYTAVNGYNGNTRVFRINENDERDTDFNAGSGNRTLNFYNGAGTEFPLAVIETATNEFLLVSRQDSSLNLAKINSDGSLVSSFGTDGLINNLLGVNRYPAQVIQAQDGSILVLARDADGDDQGLYLYRFNTDGELDATFGDSGYALLALPAYATSMVSHALLQQSDGHLLVAYSFNNSVSGNSVAGVAKFSANGKVDDSFGNAGKALYDLGDLISPTLATLTGENSIVFAGSGESETLNYFLVFDNSNDQDADGVADDEDAFPADPDETSDFDHDGIGDNTDTDDDNDSLSDSYELSQGLNPYDTNDAAGDLDGDGRNNLQEYLLGSDPRVDDVEPVLVVPADINVTASGATTSVDLGIASATDVKDGNITPVADNYGPYAPGHHTITWTASDAAGNTTSATQIVDVTPLLSIGSDQAVVEGNSANITVYLNGSAAHYPVTVPYTVAGNASYPADHDLVAGSLTITQGTSASMAVNTLVDGVFEGSETLTITLGTPSNAVLGSKTVQTLSITETNVAPTVSIQLQQADQTYASIYADQGQVTVRAIVTDLNVGDDYSVVWQDLSADLQLGNSYQGDSFSFDPVNLVGNYSATAVVTDSAGAEVSERVLIHVVSTTPYLSAGDDSDGDGISDADEGTADNNANRIADYLDHSNASNLLPAAANGSVIAVAADLTLALGDMAYGLELHSSQLSLADIARYTGENLADASDYLFMSGIFDFEVRGFSAGSSVQLVLPLTSAVPTHAQYIKYVTGQGWSNFVEDSHNRLASAPGALGVCPEPGSSAYTPGLHAGDFCVQLTLQDGGANDADGSANGVIKDPGAVATLLSEAPTVSVSVNSLPDTRFAARNGERVVFSFTLHSDATDAMLSELSLQASGTLNETSDIGAVKLYRDANHNGIAEASERIGSGSYSADNGELNLLLDTAYQLPVGDTTLLVTYTF